MRVGETTRVQKDRRFATLHKRVSPFRVGILGIACYAGSIAWVATWSKLVHRADPPGWIVEHTIPAGAYYLAAFGGLLFISALLWAVARWILHKGSS